MRRRVGGRDFGFVASVVLRNDRVSGEFAGSKRVINSLPSKRLHHSRRITNEEKGLREQRRLMHASAE